MSIKTWLMRRALGRLRITDDIVRYLTTFQRLGEKIEVEMPSELLPVGARTVFRAVRTRAAAQLGPSWVWPYWLEQQLDPGSPSFVPRGHLPVTTNVTHRNWTAVGAVGTVHEGIVDARGLVTPWFDGWSLDWWVGADDRWHLPSRDGGVRQGLVEDTPVVETLMRIPSGDARQRVYGIPGDPPMAIVEITNQSPVPVAIAFAVRPYNPEGLAVVERIALSGATVTVDGRPALFLPREPAKVAASTFHDGDSAGIVMRGEAGDSFDSVRCEAGMAQAAFVFPLPHTATLRVALPLNAPRRTRRRGLVRRRIRKATGLPSPLPTSDEVAKGWQAQTRRGMRLDLPEGRIAQAVEANRRFLLLFHDGDDITPGPYTYHRFWFRDAAYMLGAMDRFGFHAESSEVLATFAGRQRVDGFYFSQRQEWDANGAALHALAEHWRLTRDDSVLDAETIARGVRWIERKRRSRRKRKDPALDGLLPASISAEHLGPFDYYYWDDFWSVRGMRDGAFLLRQMGQIEAAAAIDEQAEAFWADVLRSLDLVATKLGTAAIPAGPRRRIDAGSIGSLVACSPLGLLPADDPRIEATAQTIRDQFCIGPAFFQSISHTGLGTYLTLQLAFIELEKGDRRALDRLQWMVDAATDTFTWPEAIHPQIDGGCMGDGHHGWAAADFLNFVRQMLVREVDGHELLLCSLLPDAWLGQPLEVVDAPTHFGLLSFAVRWHGERPALLWDLRRHADLAGQDITIRVPGLDPAWSTIEDRGDALLAAPADADVSSTPPPGESFS
ncbi:MAG: hypothetical protein ACR2H3_14160 [Acidimicrobiales bacterium]